MIPIPEIENIIVATSSEKDPLSLVFPQEIEIADSFSSEKRKRDFLLGRKAAHKALTSFQVNSPISRDTRGAPIWPEKIVGSISHTSGWGIAALGDIQTISLLGIDLTEITERAFKIIPRVTTREEQHYIHTHPTPHIAACILFAVKESLYKALYPQCKRYIGFQEALVFISNKKDPQILLTPTLQSDLGESFKPKCKVITNQDFVVSTVYQYINAS